MTGQFKTASHYLSSFPKSTCRVVIFNNNNNKVYLYCAYTTVFLYMHIMALGAKHNIYLQLSIVCMHHIHKNPINILIHSTNIL